MDGWTDGWMDGWMDQWMDGYKSHIANNINIHTYIHTYIQEDLDGDVLQDVEGGGAQVLGAEPPPRQEVRKAVEDPVEMVHLRVPVISHLLYHIITMHYLKDQYASHSVPVSCVCWACVPCISPHTE